MDYNFNFLTPGTFEHLVQSLSRKILGRTIHAGKPAVSFE